MTNIKLRVTGANAKAVVSGVLTSGAAGIPVSIDYDSSWDGLRKDLVCTSGKWGPGTKRRTVLNIANAAEVAHEVMIEDHYLYIGVEGRNADGTLVICTKLAECGMILPGANADADPSARPELPIWAQLQQQINELKENGIGGGSQYSALPDVTAADDGKFLRVSGGVWTAQALTDVSEVGA
ncbi:MAG: hypothetical protein IKJ99_09370 [Oscillospiraceae bacterium]|nr:hypothetical protein [Oscillospiraceae bacterium]